MSVILFSLYSFLLIPNGYAATNDLTLDGQWRIPNKQEEIGVRAEQNGDNYTPQDGSNPQGASLASPGWLPDGSLKTTPPNSHSSENMLILLDLPLVDLSCSSNVTVEITNGFADILLGSDGGDTGYGWGVYDAYGQVKAVGLTDTAAVIPNSHSLIGSVNIAPSVLKSGGTLGISVETWDDLGTNAWDVHDVVAKITYDDESGSCTPQLLASLATCTFDDAPLTPGAFTIEESNAIQAGFTVAPRTTSGNLNDVFTDTGLITNPGLDADLPFSIEGFSSALTTPSEWPLRESTGISISFDAPVTTSGTAIVSIGNSATNPSWSAYTIIQPGHNEFIVGNIPSDELTSAKIVLIVPSTEAGNQAQWTLSNFSAAVYARDSVAVCGIQAQNVTTTTAVNATIAPSSSAASNTQAGAVQSSLTGRLPETGNNRTILFFALCILTLGVLMYKSTNIRFIARKY